jgi:hypothetical protein
VLRRRLADDLRQVLMLIVIAVDQPKLLLTVTGIIGGIEIDSELLR